MRFATIPGVLSMRAIHSRGVSGGGTTTTREHYQTTFEPMLYGVAIAIALTIVLKETGPAVRTAPGPAMAGRS